MIGMSSETKFLGSQKSSKDFSGPYKILPTKEFSKDFKKLNKQNQQRIKNKVEEAIERLIYMYIIYNYI